MKKIFVILFILVSAKGFSQGGWIKPNNSYGTIYNRGSFDSILNFPTGCGTAILRGYDLKKSALYMDSCGNRLYYYNPSNSTWYVVASAASSVDSVIISDSSICIWSGGSSVCGGLKKDTVDIGWGLGTVFQSNGRQQIFAIHPNGYEGGIVTWDSLLSYTVSPSIVFYNDEIFYFPDVHLTLDPPNLQPRYDVFAIDTLGPFVLKGDSAAVPTIPQAGQDTFALTSGFLVNPGDTAVSTMNSTTVYDETGTAPDETTVSTSGTITSNITNTDNPYHLTHDIFVSKYTNGSRHNFLFASPQIITDGQVLTGFIWLNRAITTLNFRLFNGSTASTNNIAINNNYGINDSLTGVYQRFAIPFSAFTKNIDTFTTIRITNSGYDTSGAGGYYLDDIQLQSGVSNILSKLYADSAGTYRVNDSEYVSKTWKNGIATIVGDTIHTGTGNGGGSGTVVSVTGSPSGLVDNTDPANPVVQQDVTKVNVSDTATMLSPYLKNIDTTNIPNFSVKVRSLFSATSPITYNSATGKIAFDTAVIHTSAYNDATYQGKLTLTTTGTSGASTLTGNTLNIPQYSGLDTTSLINRINNKAPHTGIITSQDSIVIFGDSYAYGVGATGGKDYFTLLCSYLNAVGDNHAVSGTSLEKRSPLNFLIGPNFIDNLSTVPLKTNKKKLLIIAYGLNDVGQNGTNYNPANFKTDYDSALNYIINTKMWPAKNILLIPPYYIGSKGYAAYAIKSGNPAPTAARHLQFVDTTMAVANKWGTLYFNIYDDQLRNDTTLISTADSIHATDSGYLYIAKDMAQYLIGNNPSWGKYGDQLASGQFIGSTNAQDVVIKANNVSALTVKSNSTSGLVVQPNVLGAKWYFLDQTAGLRFGVGMASVQPYVQFFAPTATNGWTFNGGGDLQTPGTLEYLKINSTGINVTGTIVGSSSAQIAGNLTGVVTLDQANTIGAKVYWANGGATFRNGVGINASAPSTQFFTSSGGNGWSWNTGGDLQATGTNELMRLTSTGLSIGSTTVTDKFNVSGNINLLTAGNKIKITTGTNASIGVSGAMTSGSITISTTAVTASSKIFLTHAGTTITNAGELYIGTITAGTSFVINSTNSSDTDTVNWWIIN